MGCNHTYYGSGNDSNVKTTDLTLNKDENGYYLSGKFRVEDKHSIRELIIPKIRLNTSANALHIKTDFNSYDPTQYAQVNIGFGYLPLDFATVDGVDIMFKETILEEKYTEMTMDEIEKKLGYKVKIVNK